MKEQSFWPITFVPVILEAPFQWYIVHNYIIYQFRSIELLWGVSLLLYKQFSL